MSHSHSSLLFPSFLCILALEGRSKARASLFY